MKPSADYIANLTPLRGLAALWVMVFHIDVTLFYRDLGALVSRDATGLEHFPIKLTDIRLQ